MKYSKNSVLSFLLLLLLQSGMPCFASDEKNIKVFSSVLAKGYEVQVKYESARYWYRLGSNEWILLKGGVLEGGEAKEVLFMDVNDDSINDVFVKLFETGANSEYALFITELKDGLVFFSEHAEVFGSPYLNNQGELVSVKHDGPFSKVEMYKGERGEFYRYKLREAINSDLERVTTYDKSGGAKFSINFLGTSTAAVACVSSERAYLSTSPSLLDITKAYVVKGDAVSVLDSDSDGEWFKVRYHGKIVTDAWVSQETLNFNEVDGCGEE